MMITQAAVTEHDMSKIIIIGTTVDGRKFRPSDWAQRLATAVGTPGADRRVRFHPKVKIAAIEGINCVVVDRSLEEEEPMLFAFLVDFANSNQLKVEED